MPFRSLFSSPPKKQYKQRKEAHDKRCNRKKFDPNLLKQLGDNCQIGLLETGKPHKFSKPPSLPYSKNFGSFDITWCVAKDSQYVVLVEYADRSFINGQQIILSPDDGKVLDARGQWDVKMQDYYDRALKIKENRERGARAEVTSVERLPSTSNALILEDLDGHEQILKETSNLLRSLTEANRNPEICQFDKQLLELETLFGRIITRCCNLGLGLSLVSEIWETDSGRKEDVSQMELAARSTNTMDNNVEYDQKKVATVLERMIDQYKSMVELSSVFQWQQNGRSNGEDEGTISSDAECVSIADSSWSITDDFKQLGISRSILSLRQVSEKSSQTTYQSQSLHQQNHLSLTSFENLDDECDGHQQMNGPSSTICEQNDSDDNCSADDNGGDVNGSIVSTNESVLVDSKCCIQSPNKQSLQAKNQVLQNEIIRLRTMNDDLCTNVRHLTDSNLKFTGEVGKLKRENEDLNKCLRNSTKSKSEWNQNMRDLEREIVELETKVTVTDKQNVLLSTQLEDTNSECVSVKTRLRTMERESGDQLKYTAKLESERKMHRNDNDRLQLNILELQSRLSSTMTENTQNLVELGTLKKDNNDKQIELLQLRTKLQKQDDARASHQEQTCALESELERLTLCLDRVTENCEHLQKRVESLESDNRSLLAERADAQRRIEHLETRCLNFDMELREEKAKVDALTATNGKLKESECILRADNEKLRMSVHELSEINEQLRSKLYKFEKGSTELECKFSRLVEAKGDLQNVIRQLSHVNLNIEQRFKRMDTEYSDLECRLHNMDKLTTEYGHIDWGDQLGCTGNVTPAPEAISPRQ